MSAELRELQEWMQDFITTAEPDESRAASLVRPSLSLNSAQRMHIYRDMYLLRMADALAVDFPAVKRYLGDDDFRSLVASYVATHPSRSYSLNRLRDRFPEFIDEQRPGFCGALAELEGIVASVFDAPRSPRLSPDALAHVADWGAVRVEPIAALCLLASPYSVNAYLQSVQNGTEPSSPESRATAVLVCRPAMTMCRYELEPRQFLLLDGLLQGRTVYEAFEPLLGGGDPRVADALFGWFRAWVEAGFFTSLQQDER